MLDTATEQEACRDSAGERDGCRKAATRVRIPLGVLAKFLVNGSLLTDGASFGGAERDSLKVTRVVEGVGLIGHDDPMRPISDNIRLPGGARAPSGLTDPPRRARLSDLDEVIRLASLMYEDMGMDASDEEWRRAAAEHVRRRLGDDLMVFVVEDPTHPGHLAATGAGSIAARLPGPSNPSARVGYIQWISTEVVWRRRGLARAIATALIDWFGEQEVRAVELHATREAEPLYRALGFDQGANPGLRIPLDRSARWRNSED